MSHFVSIIICTRDRAQHLSQTLEALKFVRVPQGMNAELIVVDNASTDDTCEVVRSYSLPGIPVEYLYEARGGKSHAYNAALGAARGEILLFTDDDVLPPRDWIAGMCAPIAAGAADAVAGGVRLAPHLLRPWMTPFHRAMLASTELMPPHPDGLVGANMAFARRVLERVPRFDPELGPGALGFCDDTLLALQFQAAGYRVLGAPDVEVEHHPQASRLLRAGYRDMVRKLGGSMAYVARHWKHEEVTGIYPQLLVSYIKIKMLATSATETDEIQLRELQHLLRYHFLRQYLREKKRPANYEKHGLVKLSASKL